LSIAAVAGIRELDPRLYRGSQLTPRDVIGHDFAARLAWSQAPAGPRLDNGRAARKGSPSLFAAAFIAAPELRPCAAP